MVQQIGREEQTQRDYMNGLNDIWKIEEENTLNITLRTLIKTPSYDANYALLKRETWKERKTRVRQSIEF